jgi:hypothetical protein
MAKETYYTRTFESLPAHPCMGIISLGGSTIANASSTHACLPRPSLSPPFVSPPPPPWTLLVTSAPEVSRRGKNCLATRRIPGDTGSAQTSVKRDLLWGKRDLIRADFLELASPAAFPEIGELDPAFAYDLIHACASLVEHRDSQDIGSKRS